jgi:hypothetical protein
LKIKKGGWGIIFLVTFLLSYIFILVITALAIWLSIFSTQDDYAPDGSNYLQGVKDQGTGIRGQGSGVRDQGSGIRKTRR